MSLLKISTLRIFEHTTFMEVAGLGALALLLFSVLPLPVALSTQYSLVTPSSLFS